MPRSCRAARRAPLRPRCGRAIGRRGRRSAQTWSPPAAAAAIGPAVPSSASLPPAGKPAYSGGLLRMLSGALLRALEDEDGTQPGGAPASETSRVEAAEADALAPTSPRRPCPGPPGSIRPRTARAATTRCRSSSAPTRPGRSATENLPEELLRAVDAYAVNLLGSRASGRVQLPLDYVQGSLIRDTWEERRGLPPQPQPAPPHGPAPRARGIRRQGRREDPQRLEAGRGGASGFTGWPPWGSCCCCR